MSGPLPINSDAPDFEADTTQGHIRFHEWLGNSWGILFSHPKDFTPVCTTELGYMARIKPEFDKRNVKIIGLSVDPVDRHEGWSKDIAETQGTAPNYPMIGDPNLKIAKLYGMLPGEAGETCEGRTAADNATVRNVYVIGPDKKIKLVLSYPMRTGPQLRRGAPSHRLDAADGEAQGRDAGELEARRRRDHSAGRVGRGSQGEISRRLARAQAIPADRSPAAQLVS